MDKLIFYKLSIDHEALFWRYDKMRAFAYLLITAFEYLDYSIH